MENRDPNNLNPHLQVQWEGIIGEPAGLRTPDKCWNCSKKCYDLTRRCCYVFLAVLFAPILACCSGIQFAYITFCQVWCIGPCLRCAKINWLTFKKFWEICLFAYCGPMAEVCGMCCSKIHIRYQKLPDGSPPDSKDYFTV